MSGMRVRDRRWSRWHHVTRVRVGRAAAPPKPARQAAKRSGVRRSAFCVRVRRSMPPMPHVVHGQHRAGVQRGDCRAQPGPHRERPCREAGAVHRLRDDRERVLPRGLDDHVVGLGDRDAELVDRHRPHRQAVGGHDRHLQPGNAQVEVRHRRPVDHAQSHALARREQPRPVACGGGAVEQVRVGGSGHVGQVRRAHAHLSPGQAIRHRLGPALLAKVAHQIDHRALPPVVVVRLLLQLAVDPLGRLVGPVAEQQHVLAVARDGIGITRMDHDRTVEPLLFLEAGMAVIPVRARLLQGEAIGEAAACRNAVETQPWHAVHVRGQHEPMPVNRRHLVQRVADTHRHGVALAPLQQRRRQRAVHGDGRAIGARDIDRRLANLEIELAAAQRVLRHEATTSAAACRRQRRAA